MRRKYLFNEWSFLAHFKRYRYIIEASTNKSQAEQVLNKPPAVFSRWWYWLFHLSHNTACLPPAHNFAQPFFPISPEYHSRLIRNWRHWLCKILEVIMGVMGNVKVVNRRNVCWPVQKVVIILILKFYYKGTITDGLCNTSSSIHQGNY